MTIELNKEYPEFRVTHTLHQLVDNLNDLATLIEGNLTLVDSGLNNIFDHYAPDAHEIYPDSAFTMTAEGLDISSTEGAARFGTSDSSSMTEIFSDGGNIKLSAENHILLDTSTAIGSILLSSSGSVYGAIKRRSGSSHLTMFSGGHPAIDFDNSKIFPSTTRASFPAEVRIPFLETKSDTVHGAINEVRVDTLDKFGQDRIRLTDLEDGLTALDADVKENESSINSIDNRVTTLEAMNISSRLTNIESQIVAINNRLGLLGI